MLPIFQNIGDHVKWNLQGPTPFSLSSVFNLEQRRFLRDCTFVQSRTSLRCLHNRLPPTRCDYAGPFVSVRLSSYLQFSTKSIADLYETVHLCNLARAFAACICNTNNLVGTVLVFFLSSGHLCLIFYSYSVFSYGQRRLLRDCAISHERLLLVYTIRMSPFKAKSFTYLYNVVYVVYCYLYRLW